MSTDWYVWFRFFDSSRNRMVQKRFKKGVNEFHNYKERLLEIRALRDAITEELAGGWNPLTRVQQPSIRIHSITEAIDYVLKLKSATLRTKSRYAYTYIMKMFKEWLTKKQLGNTAVKWFRPIDAQEYMDHLLLNKKYSGRTFNDHLIILRTFFNCFMEREWIDRNPFRSVKRKKTTIGRNLAYTESERNRLISELKQRDLRMYFFSQIIFHCFIRRTELTCIKVKHVDLTNFTIIIPGDDAKNGHQESVVIPKDLEPVLKEMELHKYSSEDYLFGRRMITGPVQFKNPDHISTRHNNLVKELGIDAQKGLYSWKHSGVCEYYYLTGKDLYALMRQLRHRDISTTQIYLKSLGLIQNEAFRNARVA